MRPVLFAPYQDQNRTQGSGVRSRRFGSALGLGLLAGWMLILSGVTPVRSQELFLGESDPMASKVDAVYVKGLQYLVRNQTPQGYWEENPYGQEPAVVGLAILSMLAHGEDPNRGPYGQAIERGLNHILSRMNDETGYIGRSMYNHGFATLALAEAYGMVEDNRLGPALEKAVRLILDAQKRNPLGAWRYSPESTDADTTVSGAQIVALYAARNAGIAVPEKAIQQGLGFLLKCQTPEGGFGYTSNASPNAPRTAIGCLCLALADEKNSPEFKKAFQYLMQAPAESHYRQYYLYYGAQAFFQGSPEAWEEWNRENIKTLAASQNPDGSWDGRFGSTFATSASLLSLALNYRFLPIYER